MGGYKRTAALGAGLLVRHHRPTVQDHETLWFASPVDGEVRAEAARREFMQTMSKTFAQLSTGLAIFDRKRALIHFNPALLDITGLDFEALGSKPDLPTLP